MFERRAAEPVMPMSLFRNRNFSLVTVAGLLTGVAMFGALAYMPTYLQMAAGVSATKAGLLMIPMMGSLLVTSIVTGQLVTKTYNAGEYFDVPAKSGFTIEVASGICEYICSFLR